MLPHKQNDGVHPQDCRSMRLIIVLNIGLHACYDWLGGVVYISLHFASLHFACWPNYFCLTGSAGRGLLDPGTTVPTVPTVPSVPTVPTVPSVPTALTAVPIEYLVYTLRGFQHHALCGFQYTMLCLPRPWRCPSC